MKAFVKDYAATTKRKLRRAHTSWTIWINGVTLSVLEILRYAQDSFPALKEYLTPATYSQVMLYLVAVNIALRFKTNKSLADK